MRGKFLKKAVSIMTAAMISASLLTYEKVVYASEIQYGDVDGDSTVNSSDALNILGHITGLSVLESDSLAAADVNGDGEVNSSDAFNVLQYVVGTIDRFAAEETIDAEDIRSFYEICSDTIKENDAQYGLSIMSDEFHSKRIIAKSSEKLDISSYNPVNAASGIDNEGNFFCMAQFDTVEDAELCLNYLNGLSSVEYAEFDEYMSGGVDAGFDIGTEDIEAQAINSWGVKSLEADKYAEYLKGLYNNTIKVAVVDTGVSEHSFMSGRILNGYDFVDNDSDANDQNYHGTHVAGTIVDCTPSLNIDILPVRVLDKDGGGSEINVGNGIRYAAEAGADVINLSLGGESCSKYIDDSIKFAVSKGAAVVVSAGNDGNNTSSVCPAHIDKCIVVSAVDSNLTKASFSNYGNSVDFAAPGVAVKSCIPGGSYKELDGTSMAAPHISAIAAMMKYSNPDMTTEQISDRIKSCCQDLGDKGYDIYYGYGFPKLSKLLPAIAINQTSATLAAGKSLTLNVSTVPSGQTLTWTSSDTSVAKINNGIVTAVKAGKAVITATMTYNGNDYSVDCSITVTEPAADTGLVDSQEYYIVPKCAANLCLVVANNAKSDKSNVCLGSQNSASSVWVAHKSGNYWYFVNKNSGKVLDIYGDTIASKSNAQIWSANLNGTQLFIAKEYSTGYYTLSPKANTKISLDVYGDSGWKAGTNVWTYTTNNNNTQQFSFKKVSSK